MSSEKISEGVLSREHTAIIKCFAILIMIYSHFFGLFNVDTDIASRALQNPTFSHIGYLARCFYGSICIDLFAFVSGYGYCVASMRESRGILQASVGRISRFYPFFLAFCSLFFLLAIFFPYGTLISTDQYIPYLLTMAGFRNAILDYWYISVVLLSSLVIYPILLLARRKGNKTHLACYISLCLLLAASDHLIYQALRIMEPDPAPTMAAWVSSSYHHALQVMPCFLLGWAVASVKRTKISVSCCLLGIGLIAFLIRNMHHSHLTILFASFILLSACSSLFPLWLRKALVLIGNYSACMWLNHRLLFGYWFAEDFYRLPTPLNYFVLVALSFALSFVITNIWEKLSRHRLRSAPPRPKNFHS